MGNLSLGQARDTGRKLVAIAKDSLLIPVTDICHLKKAIVHHYGSATRQNYSTHALNAGMAQEHSLIAPNDKCKVYCLLGATQS